MPDLSIEDIAERFPDFRVALLIAEPLNVRLRGPALVFPWRTAWMAAT